MSPRIAARIRTPLGTFVAAVDGSGALLAIDFDEHGPISSWKELVWDERALAPVARALERYFSGRLREFELAVEPAGTPFQQRVWRELSRIPYGETISYAELARRLGAPRAVRAVGRANGANPIPIVIPCHRVIGADGTLTGYGGGIERKRALLELEAKHSGPSERQAPAWPRARQAPARPWERRAPARLLEGRATLERGDPGATLERGEPRAGLEPGVPR